MSLCDDYSKGPENVPHEKKGQGLWFCHTFLSLPYATISNIQMQQLIQTKKVELGRRKQLIVLPKPPKASSCIKPGLGERRKFCLVKCSEIWYYNVQTGVILHQNIIISKSWEISRISPNFLSKRRGRMSHRNGTEDI